MKKYLRKAILRYIGVFLILGPANILVITFPVAWILRFLGKFNPLWIVLDDTRLDSTQPSGLAEDYRIFLNDYKYRWIGVFLWHVNRNSIWNLREMFVIPKYTGVGGNQRISILEYYHDGLYQLKDNWDVKYPVEQDGWWSIGAGLKFMPKHLEDDPYQVNRGEVINPATTILGKGYILYQDDYTGWIGFRYTSCEIIKPWWGFGKKFWLTKYFGSNASRYTLKYKIQAIKPWSFEVGPTNI